MEKYLFGRGKRGIIRKCTIKEVGTKEVEKYSRLYQVSGRGTEEEDNCDKKCFRTEV